MRNIKLTIEYDGTSYAGWQCQKSQVKSHKSQVRTIQETIERVLRRVLQEKINLIASGRTDAGVHASAQVANFKTTRNIPSEKLQRALNGLLPDDIIVSRIEEVPLDFHSRFSAKSKIYRYTILNRPYPSAFLRNSAYFYPYPLDIRAMRKAAKRLIGRHDFKAFCSSGSSAKSTIRTIKKIVIARRSRFFVRHCEAAKRLKQSQKRDCFGCLLRPSGSQRLAMTGEETGLATTEDLQLITIDIEADGFLYNMARRIIGSFINGSTAPSRGLCLLKVKY